MISIRDKAIAVNNFEAANLPEYSRTLVQAFALFWKYTGSLRVLDVADDKHRNPCLTKHGL